MKLNLGSGDKPKEGWINVDKSRLVNADVILDLETYPWIFSTSSADEISVENILEHVENPVRFMEEIYRVAKPNAKIYILVPYWNCEGAWNDPTHKRGFGVDSMLHFTEESIYSYYTTARFKILDYEPKGLKKWIGLFVSNVVTRLSWTLEVVK